ncbi:MAG: FkbM family methyltransferase [Phyllobacteriaceae bacterium]|jgi:FkbM family methyltransferase|nr:FkbM family methyltransferase [Phyllobacteriaceae bacterium]
MKPFVSYAQNFEDVMLWRALKHVENGFYIDVGAEDPSAGSVSKAFYDNGWSGVSIEPSPSRIEELLRQRPRDVVIQAAVATAESKLTMFLMPGTSMLTGHRTIAENLSDDETTLEEVCVDVISLKQVFDKHPDQTIHWLKIDVEGMEADVIASWKGSDARPWIVVVESTKPFSQEASYREWEPDLVAMDYVFAYGDGLNRFYVHEEHRSLAALFDHGPGVFDDFILSLSGNSPALRDAWKTLAEERSRADGAADEITKLTAQVDDLSAEVRRLDEQYRSTNLALSAEVGRLDEQCRDANLALSAETERLLSAQDLVDRLRHEREAILSSRSWRLTRPLRSVRRFLKGRR